MRIEDLHPKDAERQYGPHVADLARRHTELQRRHDQLAATVDDLLNITEKGPAAVALVADLDKILRNSVPK